MNIFQITKKSAIFCLGVSALYASSAQAQSFQKKKNGKKQHVEVPKIPTLIGSEEELQVLEAFDDDTVELHLQTGLLETAKVPKTLRKYCQISRVTMTVKSYIFECYNDLAAASRAERTIWSIRRNGTQPKWALSSDDAKDVSELVRRSNERSYNGERAQPARFLLYSKAGTKAPNQYCNRNAMDNSPARPVKFAEDSDLTPDQKFRLTQIFLMGTSNRGHNNYDCYDLMSITYVPGY